MFLVLVWLAPREVNPQKSRPSFQMKKKFWTLFCESSKISTIFSKEPFWICLSVLLVLARLRWRGDWRRPPSLSPHSYGHLPLHIIIIVQTDLSFRSPDLECFISRFSNVEILGRQSQKIRFLRFFRRNAHSDGVHLFQDSGSTRDFRLLCTRLGGYLADT